MRNKILLPIILAGLFLAPAAANADDVDVQVYGSNDKVNVYVYRDSPSERSTAPLSCDEEENLRSLGTSTPTAIRFVNDSDEAKDIYWLDHTGERKLYATIQSGEQASFDTYITHPWVITAEDDDECENIYMPTTYSQTIRLK